MAENGNKYVKRIHDEVNDIYKELKMDMILKTRKIDWLRYTERMIEEWIERKITWMPDYQKKREISKER